MDGDRSERPPRAGRPRRRDAPLGIKAVEQALDVVDALARSKRSCSLMELSVATAMEPSKLHRYLVSLCARGLVKRNETTGLYDLGPGALSLGVIALARLDEFTVVRAIADSLSKRLHEAAFVYVWSQAGPVLVHSHRPAFALVGLRLGSVVPLIDSATGPVFLAYMPAETTAPIFARDAADKGLDPEAKWRAMADVYADVRRDRVMWSDVTIVPNSAACAGPVLDAQGNLLCVMGVSYYLHGTQNQPQAHIIDAVQEAAAAASAGLGYQS